MGMIASIAKAMDLRAWVGPVLITLLATLTFGTRYWQPQSLFWDENYHVASAQKQLAGVMYMETHPPLGKMLIALGEWSVGVNAGKDTSRLLQRDHVSNNLLPPDYSYTGVRLASVLSMILAAPLLFGLIRLITGSRWSALIFGSLLVFDNALVLHTRAAMLEGMQIFFVLLALYVFARLVRGPQIRLWHYLLLGALIGLVVAVKLNGAVLLLLLVALFAVDQWQTLLGRRYAQVLLRLSQTVVLALVGLLGVFLGVFYVQIASSTEVLGTRTYKASPEYLAHLQAGTSWTPSGFVVGLRDHLRYIAQYSEGVPRLDACKPGENGSHALRWPLGGKTINYRWNKDTIEGRVEVSYSYLIGNPLIWLPVLGGIGLSLTLLIGRVVYGQAIRERRLFLWLLLCSSLYLAYMSAILQIERVMYLYHYLLPLIFGIVNLAVVHAYVFADGLARSRWHTRINLLLYLGLVITGFLFFAPLTYGWPLTEQQFELRQWFDHWQLEPVR
jgi:dolichyl-phosphate-mannose--protein O-mannosyl transferase